MTEKLAPEVILQAAYAVYHRGDRVCTRSIINEISETHTEYLKNIQKISGIHIAWVLKCSGWTTMKARENYKYSVRLYYPPERREI